MLQVLVELVATRREEQSGSGSRYTSLAVLESVKCAAAAADRCNSAIAVHPLHLVLMMSAVPF